MNAAKIPQQPLERIALSLSGGGYRAAAFHLGAMSYLHHLQFRGKPLLEKVKLLSTVSGGTITGLVYALQKQQGTAFPEVYHFIMHRLHTLDLVKAGIEKLNPTGQWDNPHKRKNLINAFAELYDRHFTGGASFGVFNNMQSHLEALVVNSTEFDNAINFRFRNRGTGYFGNFMMRVPQAIAEEVKLADAMAASSCFPGGFEPMVWPHDFSHAAAPGLQALAQTATPVGLMDGGIYDNQGIESILNYKKNSTEPYFDLVIVSDVSSPMMDPFRPAKDAPKEGFRKLTIKDLRRKLRTWNRRVNTVLVSLLLLLGLLPLANGYANNILTGICLGLAIAVALLLAGKALLAAGANRLLARGLEWLRQRIPPFYIGKLAHLHIEELSVRRMEPLVKDRVQSVLVLLTNVFLKVVRRLNYYKLYDDKRYRYRRMTNLIRDLTEKARGNKEAQQPTDQPQGTAARRNSILQGAYNDVVGDGIREVAEDAASFGTTLWFTEAAQLDKMLDKLIASGSFTLCYNLLAYLELAQFDEDNGFADLPVAVQQDIATLYEQCKQDWLRFKEDPMWLCEVMGEQAKSTGDL